MVHHTMNTRINSAPSASSRINHMRQAYRARGAATKIAAMLAAATLAGCGLLASDPRYEVPAPERATPPAGAPIVRAGSRWLPVAWRDLPGWGADRPLEAWVALRRSCERLTPEMARAWQRVCADALRAAPADDAAARNWLQQRLAPYRVLPLDPAASGDGLATGYFEPLVEASRVPRAAFRVPLHAPPAMTWPAQALVHAPADRHAARGPGRAARPRDRLRGRPARRAAAAGAGLGPLMRVAEPDGRVQVRLAYAGHNDQPYKSVGRWLIEQGELRAEQASWPAIKAWARANPKRVNADAVEPTRAWCSSAKSRCPTRPSAARVRRACR
jgi:membrane-bound lytic murein transglycosylase A